PYAAHSATRRRATAVAGTGSGHRSLRRRLPRGWAPVPGAGAAARLVQPARQLLASACVTIPSKVSFRRQRPTCLPVGPIGAQRLNVESPTRRSDHQRARIEAPVTELRRAAKADPVISHG